MPFASGHWEFTPASYVSPAEPETIIDDDNMLDADGDTVFNTDDAGDASANASSDQLSGGLDSADLEVSNSFLSQTDLDVELGKRKCSGPLPILCYFGRSLGVRF